MAKRPRRSQPAPVSRPLRVKLSAEESLKRVREFAQRKGAFIAAVAVRVASPSMSPIKQKD